MIELPLPPLPLTGWAVHFLAEADASLLQAFFDANPEYFRLADGHPAGPEEAIETLQDAPPPEFSWSAKGVPGFFGPDGELCAMAQVIADLMVPGVWHIGLFILATDRHGKGEAQALVAWLENLARSQGAHWMRLGVLAVNPRAARFWAKCGYLCARRRYGVVFGEYSHDIDVMMKPLSGGSVDDYLALVVRDRPEA